MKRIISLLFSVISVIFIMCRKDDSSKSEQNLPKINNVEWTVMSNPTDPMLVMAKSENSQIELYGDRDDAGIPSKLKEIVIKSSTDTISLGVDDLDRPTFYESKNKFQLRYSWKDETHADIFYTSQIHKTVIKVPFVLSDKSKRNLTNSNSAKVEKKAAKTTNNIIVDVTECGKPITSDIGTVHVDVKTFPGEEIITTIRATFENGKYVAKLPQETTKKVFPSPTVCRQIKTLIGDACKFVNLPAFKESILFVCTNFIYFVPQSAPVCAVLVPTAAAAAIFCKVFNDRFVDRFICNATYQYSIYGSGISLQPRILYNSNSIYGSSKSDLIGGPQTFNLTLDIPGGSNTIIPTSTCGSYTWSITGETYSNSGKYLHISNPGDCADTTTLDLTIKNEIYTITQTACDSYTWSTGTGATYTESGLYDFVTTGQEGCTVTTTLDLTINKNCDNDSVLLHFETVSSFDNNPFSVVKIIGGPSFNVGPTAQVHEFKMLPGTYEIEMTMGTDRTYFLVSIEKANCYPCFLFFTQLVFPETSFKGTFTVY